MEHDGLTEQLFRSRKMVLNVVLYLDILCAVYKKAYLEKTCIIHTTNLVGKAYIM